MEWTDAHDDLLFREILTVEPYQYKASTVKRGNAWTQIADILNAIPEPVFKVNQRSVRERYSLLEKAFLKRTERKKRQVELIHQNLRIMKEVLKRFLRKQRRLQFRSEMMITLKFSRRGKK